MKPSRTSMLNSTCAIATIAITLAVSGNVSAQDVSSRFGLSDTSLSNSRAATFGASSPDVIAVIGLGVNVGPGYFGADEYETSPSGSFSLRYLRFPNGVQFGSPNAGRGRLGFSIGPSFRLVNERDGDDYDDINGLDKVDRSLEAGLKFSYEQEYYRLFATARYGVIGHEGWTGNIGLQGIVTPMDGLTVSVGPRVTFGDDTFSDTYFGVTAAEAGTSALTEYDPEGGIISAGMVLRANYQLNDLWGLEGTATYDRLLNDAEDSPITQAGDANQYSIGFGVTRKISLDF